MLYFRDIGPGDVIIVSAR